MKKLIFILFLTFTSITFTNTLFDAIQVTDFGLCQNRLNEKDNKLSYSDKVKYLDLAKERSQYLREKLELYELSPLNVPIKRVHWAKICIKFFWFICIEHSNAY